jgi:hypothetical protein
MISYTVHYLVFPSISMNTMFDAQLLTSQTNEG